MTAIANGTTALNEHLEGRKYLVGLQGLRDMMEKAQRFVFEDMTMHVEKYVLDERFYEWIRRSWNVQYLPSIQETRRVRLPTVEEIERRTGETYQVREMVIVKYEDYLIAKWARERFPRLFSVFRLRGGWKKIAARTGSSRNRVGDWGG